MAVTTDWMGVIGNSDCYWLEDREFGCSSVVAWVWATIAFDWWRTPDRSSKSRSLRELEREAEAMSRSLCMCSLPPEKSRGSVERRVFEPVGGEGERREGVDLGVDGLPCVQ
ncbi:hypothetical protein FH972_004019 [Carpinus fangiana]|uniref:Uncharacterized protein n=1 Tax=Carpinus fangiana TaxID=176857 RepID=A0A5N6QMB3_9ROSI|nr:hypothetical protein FH972_004019 [Carpinus fangiana]